MPRLWILIGAGVALLSLLLGLVWYIAGAEQAKANVVVLVKQLVEQENKTKEALEASRSNGEALLSCAAVNAENARTAREQEARANAALVRLAALNGTAELNIEVLNNEADKIREKDTVCRTVDDNLPDWLVSGLREPTTP